MPSYNENKILKFKSEKNEKIQAKIRELEIKLINEEKCSKTELVNKDRDIAIANIKIELNEIRLINKQLNDVKLKEKKHTEIQEKIKKLEVKCINEEKCIKNELINKDRDIAIANIKIELNNEKQNLHNIEEAIIHIINKTELTTNWSTTNKNIHKI